MKVQAVLGLHNDDTSLNAIRLRCSDKTVLKSLEGPYGDWLPEQTITHSNYFNGAKIRQERFQGHGSRDDTAANGLKLYTDVGDVVSPGDGWWGDWSDLVTCPKGTGIVGFKTRVEPNYGNGRYATEGDDTALNDVMFQCSSILGNW